MSVFDLLLLRSLHEAVFMDKLPLSESMSESMAAAERRRDRHLGVVDKHGPNSIIVIRIGAVNTATGANIVPDYCDLTCARVRLLLLLHLRPLPCLRLAVIASSLRTYDLNA